MAYFVLQPGTNEKLEIPPGYDAVYDRKKHKYVLMPKDQKDPEPIKDIKVASLLSPVDDDPPPIPTVAKTLIDLNGDQLLLPPGYEVVCEEKENKYVLTLIPPSDNDPSSSSMPPLKK